VKLQAKAKPPAMGITAQLEESHIWDFSYQVHNCAKPQSHFNVSPEAAQYWLRPYFTVICLSTARTVCSPLGTPRSQYPSSFPSEKDHVLAQKVVLLSAPSRH